MWPKRFVYACAVKIVGAWHLVSSALAFSPPLNIPWRDAGLCGIREDKRWSWLFSRKKSEHHAFIYPREHTRTNILDHHLYLCKLGKGKRGLTACGRLVGRLSGGQVVPLCSPVTSWGLIGATNDVKEKERIVPYFFSYL